MKTDWKALCQELLIDYEQHLYRPVLADRARAALAESVAAPAEPTDEAAVEAAAELIYMEAMEWAARQPATGFISIPAWQQGGNSDAQEVARRTARAVLARYGHQPAPPAEGEVAELVEWLRLTGEGQPRLSDEGYARLTRAADLLEQRHPAPVPVAERLPEPNTKVLAHYFNALGKGRTICAIWVPAKSRSDDADFADDNFTEYDEEDDKFYWPEGWYEAIENWDDFGWVKVYEGEVVYWQPLPKWPALPLPQGESQP